jgi:hypothetical protein
MAKVTIEAHMTYHKWGELWKDLIGSFIFNI